ncbi:hypothetical protein GCM10025858_02840 [Alicyclobacillus sacchari]|nr:helix-turn-helix transcriptional regulator [Alicyclobacillus sacchari]GMA55781.1 hypothetical protein GCM10025858_02840 [Alicyclobacillus sacchari]
MRSGISTPHISSIERDKRHPSLDYAQRLAAALGVPLNVLCDSQTAYRTPNMRNSPDELPLSMQNFILNESAMPYLEAAQRMSTLSEAEASFLRVVIELLAQRQCLLRSEKEDRNS